MLLLTLRIFHIYALSSNLCCRYSWSKKRQGLELQSFSSLKARTRGYSLTPTHTTQGKYTAFKASSIHYSKCEENYHFLGFLLLENASSVHSLPTCCHHHPSGYSVKMALGSRTSFAFTKALQKSLSFLHVEVTNFVSLKDLHQSFIPFETITSKTV